MHYIPPTANDLVDVTDPVVCVLPSGSFFPIGLNHVVCTATDAAGNKASLTFTVLVCDSIAPVITQPPNVPCVEATSHTGAVVTYNAPAATDAGDANVVVTCSPASGTVFAVGTHNVVCTAADASGNRAQSVTFSVQVLCAAPSFCFGSLSLCVRVYGVFVLWLLLFDRSSLVLTLCSVCKWNKGVRPHPACDH